MIKANTPAQNRGNGDPRPLQGPVGRLPPQAPEAEKAVLGAMMLDSAAVAHAIEILAPEAFYGSRHEKIYHAIRRLFDLAHPVDITTLTEDLRRNGDLEAAGGSPYLANLSGNVATAANVQYHARIVAEKAVLRDLIHTLTQRISEAYDSGADAFDLLDKTESDIFGISETQLRHGTSSFTSLVTATLKHLEDIHGQKGDITGIASGFERLDRLTGGWQNSDLIVIAARPSMGKCLAHDARIPQCDGSVTTIAEIYRHQNASVLTVDADGHFVPTSPSAYVYDGLKPVFRVTTKLGRQVDTTLTHPFLSQDRGWVSLSHLTPGDRIAVPHRLPVFGRNHVPAEKLAAMAQSLVCVPVGAYDLALPAALPSDLYKLTALDLAFFLACVFAEADDLPRLRFSSAAVAREMQHLLLRFGVLSRVDGHGLLTLMFDRASEAHDIYWDEICSIEAQGVCPVYDLTIPDTHNFVADDVCVHNTALALACARNAARSRDKPVPVAVFSLEMSSLQLVQRLLTSEARVNAQHARTGQLRDDAFTRLVKAAGVLYETPIFIDDTPSLGILELRAKCRRLKAEHDIGLVLVDYLQLMQSPVTNRRQSNREQEIAHISRSLKALAKELNVPVIALSQLNRSVEVRGGDKRPMLSDLRESGSIEQDADVVAFIYRAERYGITQDEDGNSTVGIAEVIIGKHRNGPTGMASLAFINEYARFDNLDSHQHEEPMMKEAAEEEMNPF